ncbi:hypothetical protein LOTGIDRAFT_137600 [Lottia gigantea]|uniref:Nucleolar protein 10 n=1 Tax=Lottia gigantea TaxID=225164 RepID=V4AGY6_LOTGI|nr:hypothetical protein LOTGIDRAFT_137600 [Lottia gigantea]ESP03314.1 hypothetical protein LOTGIDRAFT_137600 [Lottia gigantea]
MQVSNPNDVKIYNLSAGKSLPEWLSERKMRKLKKDNIEFQRKIELIQDFDMPTVSHRVKVTKDGNYICTVGTYKPRVRCYDVHQLSIKFERGLDANVTQFIILSDDYSKMVFLHDDRYIEIHAQGGRYYRTRIPKFGRDLDFHYPTCDLYMVGVSDEIYRLNLEQGRFLAPLKTGAEEMSCCQFNPAHYLFACGSKQGTVECWDPRTRIKTGVLDIYKTSPNTEFGASPEVTAIKFRDALTMAVGTQTGHILLYDLRSPKPLLVKDHQYELPIKNIEFNHQLDLVFSMDTKILKIWERNTGKPYTAIEPGSGLNDLCLYNDTGLFFMANEAPKVLTYFLPALGPAPRWCSFLDNLTEELEESESLVVYDDYKFVSRQELDEMGLTHLIGSNLVKAYMHGFFMDLRFYQKAKALNQPFAYEEYKKNKIKDKIESERKSRVQIKKLPQVNRDLAEKFLSEDTEKIKDRKGKAVPNLLKDDRFSAMFNNPDFQIDKSAHEYRLVNPLITKLDKSRQKKIADQKQISEQFNEEVEGRPSEDDSSSSSDDDRTTRIEMKKQYRLLKQEERDKKNVEEVEEIISKPKFYELKDESQGFKVKLSKEEKRKRREMKRSLAERLELESGKDSSSVSKSVGNMEMTFKLKKNEKQEFQEKAQKYHMDERKELGRSAKEITSSFKKKPKFWNNERVQ